MDQSCSCENENLVTRISLEASTLAPFALYDTLNEKLHTWADPLFFSTSPPREVHPGAKLGQETNSPAAGD
jgi:hypothetical protein